MNQILLTGAAGEIGTVLRAGLREKYPGMRLSDNRPIGAIEPGEEFYPAELEDYESVAASMAGIDTVIHMGGKAQEGTWEEVFPANILGTHNVFEAARQAGVGRVIFASSHHVVGYYRRGRQIDAGVVPRPDSRYAVSKVFGEALGRMYADKHGMSVICIRIGSFQPEPMNERMLSTWLSPNDTVSLVDAAIRAQNVHFEVCYGVSANSQSWWTDSAGQNLGYFPADNAEEFAEQLSAGSNESISDAGAVDFDGKSMTRDAVLAAVTANAADEPEASRVFQGGPLCSMEFKGDISRID